jgi:hypothetical protein
LRQLKGNFDALQNLRNVVRCIEDKGEPMPDFTIADVMKAYAEDAVDLARERFQTELDFSEASLEQVESVLATLHNALPKGPFEKSPERGPSQEQIWQMSKVWGGYIGEVIRRRWGGKWIEKTTAHPGTVITLRVLGTDIFPLAKVYRRLINGPEDNVHHYYQVIRREFERAERHGE